MRLSKLLSSRYLLPTTPKFSFSKRRRSQEKQEEDSSWQQESCQEEQEQEQEQYMKEDPVFYTEDDFSASLYNLEMVALGGQSTLVYEEEREVTIEEVGETHEIKREYQRQDLEDIRRYGLSTECRQELAEVEREQENQERDTKEMQLRKVANKSARKINEDNDYGPSFIDTLCFSSKAAEDVPDEFKENDIIYGDIQLEDQDEQTPKPFDRLASGYLYKNHKDDKIGLCVKNSTTKDGIYISNLQIGSRFRWSTEVSLEGMRILSINGRPCPSDLGEAVDMMKQAEGDLKLVAASVDAPKTIPPLEDEEDPEEEDESFAETDSTEDDKTKSKKGDDATAFSDDRISALTDEKEHDRQSESSDGTIQVRVRVHDGMGEQEDEPSEDDLQEASTTSQSLALGRTASAVHYL